MRAASDIAESVVVQHADEAAFLHEVRTRLTTAPDVTIRQLARFDDRLAAHLDGLGLAGKRGRALVDEGLATPGPGRIFAAAVRGLEEGDVAYLDRIFALVHALPEVRRGLFSAFGWVSAERLRGVIRDMFVADDPMRRAVGLATCAMHRVDAGDALLRGFADPMPFVRARALEVAGRQGRVDLLGQCLAAASNDDAACRPDAAIAAVLLGDRLGALSVLSSIARAPGPQRRPALHLALMALDAVRGHELLSAFARTPEMVRLVVEGTGFVGNTRYVEYLIGKMSDPVLARVAGEAFGAIVGADLTAQALARDDPLPGVASPDGDPDDPNVAMDEDDGLPWPDADKCAAWWSGNKHRFQEGARYFMGKPPTREHCIDVLKTGYQRQRVAAAQYLCLLNPGTPLFNTAAPAWRQKRWLEKLV